MSNSVVLGRIACSLEILAINPSNGHLAAYSVGMVVRTMALVSVPECQGPHCLEDSEGTVAVNTFCTSQSFCLGFGLAFCRPPYFRAQGSSPM